jgi:hypothetical protein
MERNEHTQVSASTLCDHLILLEQQRQYTHYAVSFHYPGKMFVRF